MMAPFGQPQRQPFADLIVDHVEAQLATELAVIAALGLLNRSPVRLDQFLVFEGVGIDCESTSRCSRRRANTPRPPSAA